MNRGCEIEDFLFRTFFVLSFGSLACVKGVLIQGVGWSVGVRPPPYLWRRLDEQPISEGCERIVEIDWLRGSTNSKSISLINSSDQESV